MSLQHICLGVGRRRSRDVPRFLLWENKIMLTTFCWNSSLLDALNAAKAEYLVVGGLAVQYYCPERQTYDLDLLINPTHENAKKVKEALLRLTELGFDCIDKRKIRELDEDHLTRPKIQLPLKRSATSIKYLCADILTPCANFDFKSAMLNSLVVNINNREVHLISYYDLILHKNTDRDIDQQDVELLRSSRSKS